MSLIVFSNTFDFFNKNMRDEIDNAIKNISNEFRENIFSYHPIGIEEFLKNGMSFRIDFDSTTNEFCISVLENRIFKTNKIHNINDIVAFKKLNYSNINNMDYPCFVFFAKLFDLFENYILIVTNQKTKSNIKTFFVQIYID